MTLKQSRAKPVRNHHPWVFSGAIESIGGAPGPGDLVAVNDQRGDYLATGYFNPHSQIRVRLLTWDSNQAIGEEFWRGRLQRAIAGRETLLAQSGTNAFRLVNAEADGLPGLIVDRYAGYLVLQSLTLGIERRKEALLAALIELLDPLGVLERSDAAVRRKEGLPLYSGLLYGKEPPEKLEILENERSFLVDLRHGHKTGFYLDQRENRALFGDKLDMAGKEMLNVFSYTGGFSVYAASAGAGHICNVDSSIPVLEMAEANALLNAPQRTGDEYMAGDAFEILRFYRDEGKVFDCVVLDPPKFAKSQGDVQRASHGYKDLNMLALGLIRPGGLLATFSCSGLVTREMFQKILFGAAVDARRDVQIVATLSQAPDHPVLLTFPESAYLKGFLCRVW